MSGLLHLVEAATALTRLPVGPSSSPPPPPTQRASAASAASAPSPERSPASAYHRRPAHTISDDDADALSGAGGMAALRQSHLEALRAAAADAGLVTARVPSQGEGTVEQLYGPAPAAPAPATASQCGLLDGLAQQQQQATARTAQAGTTAQSGAAPGPPADSKEAFPARLHSLLADPTVRDVISWLPHGRSFVVLRPDAFASRVLPRYFAPEGSNSLNAKSSAVVGRDGSLRARTAEQGVHKYPSFTRKLNRWGFRQISRGQDAGAFCHELFRRDDPELCRGMVCQKSRKSKKVPLPGQPDDLVSVSSASTMGTRVSAASGEKRPYSSTVTVSTAGASASNKSLPFKKRKSGQHHHQHHHQHHQHQQQPGAYMMNDIPSMISHRNSGGAASASGTSSVTESDLTSDGGSVCSGNLASKAHHPAALQAAPAVPAVPSSAAPAVAAAPAEAAAREVLARHFHEQHRAFALASLMENSRLAMEAAGMAGRTRAGPPPQPASAPPPQAPAHTPLQQQHRHQAVVQIRAAARQQRVTPVLGAMTTHSQGVFAPTVSIPEGERRGPGAVSMAEAAKSALYSAYLQALSGNSSLQPR